MPELTLIINERHYRVSCNDGEEEKLQLLAGKLDRRVRALVGNFGQLDEGHLLAVAGLLLADDMDEAMRKKEAGYLEIINMLTNRIEAVAIELEAR